MKREEILKTAKPILFNSEMVRAILREYNPKTQTRRLIKPHNLGKAARCGYHSGDGFWIDNYDYPNTEIKNPKYIKDYSVSTCWIKFNDYVQKFAPYKTGDILYVRETFSLLRPSKGPARYVYKATDKYPFGEKYIAKFKWKPSIHMPKEAARIFLLVTKISVAKVQDMSFDDYLSEGIYVHPEAYNDPGNAFFQAQRSFAYLWNGTIPAEDRTRDGRTVYRSEG